MSKRILITGSRDWSDRDAIRSALSTIYWRWMGDVRDEDVEDIVLVSGNCPSGADALAEEVWEGWGFPVERHPADWSRWGKAAGPKRNQLMVDLGADVCLAFRKDYSRGTTHCANAATMAGIETIWFTEGEDD